MSLFKRYAKKDFLELREVTELDIDMFWESGGNLSDGKGGIVHISKESRLSGSPRIGDMVVRDITNPNFSWLIDNETFKKNFTAVVDGDGDND